MGVNVIQTPSTLAGEDLTLEGEGARAGGVPPPKIARTEDYLNGCPTSSLIFPTGYPTSLVFLYRLRPLPIQGK